MWKKHVILLPVCVLLAAAVWAFATGGADDPLVSLDYLTNVFADELEKEIDQQLDVSDSTLLEALESGTIESSVAATWTESRLKQDDILLGFTGTNVLLLAGNMQVDFASGTVVDATTGKELPGGASLEPRHRYIVAEDTAALFTVTSRTAVVDYQGEYTFAYSDEIDYNAMAGALKKLNLFFGSPTGYGQGFDLEVTPTRLQAIIMFIRVLGEEKEALAWTGGTPFADIEKGSLAEKYVGYAYHKGYTNGYGTVFKPGNQVNARQYVEFLLRAMGYSSFNNTDLSITMGRAVETGVLTQSEVDRLQAGTFLRADLVYISYYALDALLPDGTSTLQGQLQEKGVFTQADWNSARAMVSDLRK